MIEGRFNMASQEVLNAVEPLVYERDRQEFSLGDTLDMKTGLILAGLTFLALESGELIHAGLPLFQKIVQYVSIVSLVVGGVFAALELWPADYDREATPDKYLDWLEKESANCSGNADLVAQRLTGGRLERTMERIKTNLSINKRKSWRMGASFVCALVSFAANVLTLAIRLFS
jgi:hypothetical protein